MGFGSRYEKKKERFIKYTFSMQDQQADYHKQIGTANRYWKKFNEYFPMFLEELQFNERLKHNMLEDIIGNVIEYLYSYKGINGMADETLLRNKLEFLKKNFDLSKISVIESIGEEDCFFLKSRFMERFEGYDEYIIDREFWSDKNVTQLVKSLEKESQEMTPKDLSTIRRLVDYLFSNKDKDAMTPDSKNDISNFDPYSFFSSYSNIKYFIHSLLLKRHKVKGSSFELNEKRFKLLLNSFQFICLSSLESHPRLPQR